MFRLKVIHTNVKPANVVCGYEDDEESSILCKILDYDSVYSFNNFSDVSTPLTEYLKGQYRSLSKSKYLHFDNPEKYDKSISTIITYFGFYFESIKLSIANSKKINFNNEITENYYPNLEYSEELKIYLQNVGVNTLIECYMNKINNKYNNKDYETYEYDKLSLEKLSNLLSLGK